MSSRLALVTGATGFVGSHLVDALCSRGQPVRAFVRPTSVTRHLATTSTEVVAGSLLDVDAVAAALDGVDVVYHLAAATRARNEVEYARANVDTTETLLRALARRPDPPRLVYLSSLAAVGPTPDGRPLDEEAAPRPLTAYGQTKLAAERLVLGAPAPVVVLRPPAVYGPRERDLLVFFRMAAAGVVATPMGADRPVQMIHVYDLARALLAAGDARTAGRVYHVADPSIRPWSEVAALIAAALGTRPIRVPVPRLFLWAAAAVSEAGARVTGRATIFNRDKVRELLAPGWICTTDRAVRELGFRAHVPLERGIPETATWYRREGWLRAAR